MQILYVSVDGVGEARNEDVEEGTTVAQFFAAMNPGKKESDYLIRLNRVKCDTASVLEEGDRVSVSPEKVAGA